MLVLGFAGGDFFSADAPSVIAETSMSARRQKCIDQGVDDQMLRRRGRRRSRCSRPCMCRLCNRERSVDQRRCWSPSDDSV